MLLRLYYLYEKSPKKLRELENLVEDLKEVFDLTPGGNRPIRSCGTRWICHKRKALQHVVDLYGIYISHLASLAEDKSIKGADHAQIKGYLHKWQRPQMLVGCAVYSDTLKPIAYNCLSQLVSPNRPC